LLNEALTKHHYKRRIFIKVNMYDYDAVYWFIGSCIFVRAMYYVVDRTFYTNVDKYKDLPLFRQMYIQKNIVKSIYLAILTVYATFKIIIPIYKNGIWNTYTIHRLAALYGSNDFVGLVSVDKLPKTTRIHHIVSTILVFTALSLDFQESDIGQAMLVYTMASAAAYVVNFHLAIRLLFQNSNVERMRYTAGAIYMICCGCSWSWHLYWAFSRAHFNIYHLMYFLLLGAIVRDDIILMQWLSS